jgi:hypothetical protein
LAFGDSAFKHSALSGRRLTFRRTTIPVGVRYLQVTLMHDDRELT